MISNAKNIIEHNNSVKNNNFKIRDSYKAVELFGKNILIIGYGRIGKKFSKSQD
jgi:lactate dehydrogenase-like 2-hydroxyacid dehydrogenase